WQIGFTMPGSSKETLGKKAVARSQHSICLVERNGAFEPARRVDDANLTGAETRADLSVIDCLGASLETPAQRRVLQRPSIPNGGVLGSRLHFIGESRVQERFWTYWFCSFVG